jgi:hypothetical protein
MVEWAHAPLGAKQLLIYQNTSFFIKQCQLWPFLPFEKQSWISLTYMYHVIRLFYGELIKIPLNWSTLKLLTS